MKDTNAKRRQEGATRARPVGFRAYAAETLATFLMARFLDAVAQQWAVGSRSPPWYPNTAAAGGLLGTKKDV